MSWGPVVHQYITPDGWNVTTRRFTRHFSHCATDGTAFPCNGGGSGGGQFGALAPGFFRGGLLRLAVWARGAGFGRVLVSAGTGAVAGGGGGPWGLGAGSLGLENWTISCSLAWLAWVTFIDLFAVGWEKGRGIKGKPPESEQVKKRVVMQNGHIQYISIICVTKEVDTISGRTSPKCYKSLHYDMLFRYMRLRGFGKTKPLFLSYKWKIQMKDTWKGFAATGWLGLVSSVVYQS